MMKASEIKEKLLNNKYDNMFIDLYEDESLITYQNNRYTKAIEEFIKLYDDQDIEIYSDFNNYKENCERVIFVCRKGEEK